MKSRGVDLGESLITTLESLSSVSIELWARPDVDNMPVSPVLHFTTPDARVEAGIIMGLASTNDGALANSWFENTSLAFMFILAYF